MIPIFQPNDKFFQEFGCYTNRTLNFTFNSYGSIILHDNFIDVISGHEMNVGIPTALEYIPIGHSDPSLLILASLINAWFTKVLSLKKRFSLPLAILSNMASGLPSALN